MKVNRRESALRRQLAAHIGISRMARISGLDRSGIEVVAAVRPGGHILQTTQGKGFSLADAEWGALGEALELNAAEHPEHEDLFFGPPTEKSIGAISDACIAWVRVESLQTGRSGLVPAELIYCPRPGEVWLGPSSLQWTSNGMGAHSVSREAALDHAVCELVERDAVARMLPDGFTFEAARAYLVEAPQFMIDLRANGFMGFLFDVTPKNARLQTAAALIFDVDGGPVPLTAGYACRRSFGDAAMAATLEALQSRLTEIHGAREDVAIGQREAGEAFRLFLTSCRPRTMPKRSYTGRLANALRHEVWIATLTTHPWVVKAVCPLMRVSHLL